MGPDWSVLELQMHAVFVFVMLKQTIASVVATQHLHLCCCHLYSASSGICLVQQVGPVQQAAVRTLIGIAGSQVHALFVPVMYNQPRVWLQFGTIRPAVIWSLPGVECGFVLSTAKHISRLAFRCIEFLLAVQPPLPGGLWQSGCAAAGGCTGDFGLSFANECTARQQWRC
jgi:hypothetical protein